MIINYTGQDATGVGVQFVDAPTGVRAVFVDANTGRSTMSNSDALEAGGAGTATIAFPVGLPAGDYFLAAQLSGQKLAQTVKFHATGEPPTELPP